MFGARPWFGWRAKAWEAWEVFEEQVSCCRYGDSGEPYGSQVLEPGTIGVVGHKSEGVEGDPYGCGEYAVFEVIPGGIFHVGL